MPALHAIASTICNFPEKIEPITAGTISRLNTSSTPAVATELVTTMAKDRKKTKSHAHTAIRVRPPSWPSLDNAISGRRTSQCSRPIAAYRAMNFATSAEIDRQNAAHQDFLDVLRSLRRAIDDQYRRRGRDDIDDADKSLLADKARETARQRQQRGTDGGEQQGVAESRRAVDA